MNARPRSSALGPAFGSRLTDDAGSISSPSRRLRVTFLLPVFANKPVGGAKVVYQYANLLTAGGHQVTIIHSAAMEPWQYSRPILTRREAKIMGRAAFDLAHRRPAGPAWEALDSQVRTRYVPTLAPKRIPTSDAVIATSWRTAESAARYPDDRGTKAYLIQHLETWDGPAERVERTWRLPMAKIAIARWLVEEGSRLTSDSIEYIPNAIDLDTFVTTVDPKSRTPRVVMLASTSPIKGLDIGLAALEEVRRKVPHVRSTLFGVQPRPAQIPAWIDYVRNPSRDELVALYNSSSVYLCPSRGEGWHLPPAEAMACGCALVTTNIGGVADYAMADATALVAPVDDVRSLAEGVVRVLTDDTLRHRLIAAGSGQIRSFSWERSARKLEIFLQTLVAGS